MKDDDDDDARDTLPGPDDMDGFAWETAMARLEAALEDVGAEVAALKRESDRPVPLLPSHVEG